MKIRGRKRSGGYKSKELSREETVTFTYLYPLGSGFQVVDTMNDNIAIQKSCEARNVKIKFIHLPKVRSMSNLT